LHYSLAAFTPKHLSRHTTPPPATHRAGFVQAFPGRDLQIFSQIFFPQEGDGTADFDLCFGRLDLSNDG
jgi:hypothetical protein